jgi:hypothetical protein
MFNVHSCQWHLQKRSLHQITMPALSEKIALLRTHSKIASWGCFVNYHCYGPRSGSGPHVVTNLIREGETEAAMK